MDFGLGGQQRFAGIGEMAGGFYHFMANPEGRHMTAFVLPTSMGGPVFQWNKVAPDGLTRNPAGYSRGMMLRCSTCLTCTSRLSGRARA